MESPPRRAQWIRDLGLTWKSGIYPAEMAAFLGLCEWIGVRSIAESGRGPDAYSTHILGAFGAEKGIPVVSMDSAPIERFYYGDSLKQYPTLTCLKGNSFNIMVRAFKLLTGPVGLLVAGPKQHFANRLSLATCLRYTVRVVAHHNCFFNAPWGAEFQAMFPRSCHFEDLGLEDLNEWKEFRAWEKEHVGGYEVEDEEHHLPGRSLSASSLALALPSSRLRLLGKAFVTYFPLRYQPFVLIVRWALRALLG